MLRKHEERKTYSADIKHRTFGRVHLALNTKVKDTAMTRHAALEQLLNTGEPARDLVLALRGRKLTIEAVTECVRLKRPFDALRPSTWPLLGEAVTQYVEEQEAKENIATNTAKSSDQSLKKAVDYFGADRALDTITHEDVSAFKAWLKAQGLATNTVGLYLLKFGALYTHLQKRETRRANQAQRTPQRLFSPLDRDEHMPAKVQTRHRFLTEQEAERLLEATPDSGKAALALGMFAGLRIGEVLALRLGQDVNLDTGMIYVQARDGWTPKYKKNREVPVSSALEPYLVAYVARMAPGQLYLFAGRAEGVETSRRSMTDLMQRVVKDAGMGCPPRDPNAVTFHTLRHTFASWLVMSGADLFTIARLMGHATTKQVEDTYGHLSPGHKLATVEMLTTKWLNRPSGATPEGATPQEYTPGDTP
jgi:integrase